MIFRYCAPSAIAADSFVSRDSDHSGKKKATAVRAAEKAMPSQKPTVKIRLIGSTLRRPQYCAARTTIPLATPPANICKRNWI